MIARDIKLDANGDLDLTGGGSMVVDEDASAQESRVRRRTDLGEYFLDTTRGLPFQAWVSAGWSKAAQRAAALLVRSELLKVPGVASVEDPGVTVSHDATTKLTTFEATVRTDMGELLSLAEVNGASPSVGTSWDGGATVWDGGATTWI